MLYVGVTQYFRQKRLLRRAVSVPATIVKSEVFSSASADTDPRLQRSTSTTTHRPEVRFCYEVNGATHESELLRPTIIVTGYASREAAAEALAPYPVGARVSAWVDPDLPDAGFRVGEAGGGPVVFMVIRVVLPPVAWWVGEWV